MDSRIFIVGTGWYGCHIATVLLERGYNVWLLDKTGGIFQGSSAKNQNRLHLGYHYPRSPATINECRRGFQAFMDRYGHLTQSVTPNIYCLLPTDAGSKTSPENFAALFPEAVQCKGGSLGPWTPYIHPSMDPRCLFAVAERYIDPVAARQAAEQAIGHRLLHVQGECWESMDQLRATVGIRDTDCVINCTYNHLSPIPFNSYELYLTLLYRIPNMGGSAFTVMDGPFFSIYPADTSNDVYTITSVTEGVVWRGRDRCEQMAADIEEGLVNAVRDKVEAEVSNILPGLLATAEPVGYTLSWKTKPVTETDDRSLQWQIDNQIPNTLHLYGGKITGIFDAEQVVLNFVDKVMASRS